MNHRLELDRAEHKFSCAHMTVFPDGRKERLHGHNYQLGAALELADVGFAHLVELSIVKEALAGLCAEWKEHLLLAAANPRLEIARDDGEELEFWLCGQHYLLPRGDAILLPIDNVTVEALAAHAAALLADRLRPRLPAGAVRALEATVAESPGQLARCRIQL